MKIKLALLTLTLLTGHLVSTASAIVTASGFQTPDPTVNSNAQLSGLGAQSSYFGTLDGANNAFIAWEKFNSPQFSNLGWQYSSNNGALQGTLGQSGTSATLSTGGSNPGLINVGDSNYYGRLGTGPYEFSIDASSLIGAGRITLAIKHSPYFEGEDRVSAFSALLTTSTVTDLSPNLIVEGPNLYNFSDAIGMTMHNFWYIYQWDVDLAANESFSLNFLTGTDVSEAGFSIDAIALSVQPIPEPSTFMLLGAGLLGGLYLKRRRAA